MPADSKYDFQKVAERGKMQGIDFKTDPDKAREWFRQEALKLKNVSAPKVKRSAGPFANVENLSQNSIGRMYFFQYDPIHKLTLPYYDTYPLVFPFTIEADRMRGINMHYLPPFLRAKLMDALYSTANNSKYDKTMKLQITYQLLKSAIQFRYFKPCIHEYVFSHVQGPFMNINPKNWDHVLMLPLARFKKATQETVWADSLRKV